MVTFPRAKEFASKQAHQKQDYLKAEILGAMIKADSLSMCEAAIIVENNNENQIAWRAVENELTFKGYYPDLELVGNAMVITVAWPPASLQ